VSTMNERKTCTPTAPATTTVKLRQKRGDTHVGNIEREYGVDFGVRSDMRLDTLREKTGLNSIEDLISRGRKER